MIAEPRLAAHTPPAPHAHARIDAWDEAVPWILERLRRGMTGLVPIRYDGGDGIALTGYLADGSGGRPAPGVLVAHEGGGLGRHTKERAAPARRARLCRLRARLLRRGGPAARAGDGARQGAARRPARSSGPGSQAGLEVLTGAAECRPGPPRRDRLLHGRGRRHRAGPDGRALRRRSSASTAASCPATPEENAAIGGKLLLCHGADDPIVTAAQRDAFLAEATAAGIDWQLHLYGGVGHSFTNPRHRRPRPPRLRL